MWVRYSCEFEWPSCNLYVYNFVSCMYHHNSIKFLSDICCKFEWPSCNLLVYNFVSCMYHHNSIKFLSDICCKFEWPSCNLLVYNFVSCMYHHNSIKFLSDICCTGALQLEGYYRYLLFWGESSRLVIINSIIIYNIHCMHKIEI